MMKKFLSFTFIIITLFSACKKEDDFLFSQSPDQRINEKLAAYQSTLTGAENGWKAFITVNNGLGATYSFYFRFNDENRVRMVSDFDSASASHLQESSYRLRAQQQPTLIFDTYSYVHVLADPNEATPIVFADVNGGPVGRGLFSDFEFIFDDEKIREDTVELTGKVNRSKLILVKASKEEADAFSNRRFVLFSNYLDNILTYFKRLVINSQSYDIRIDRSTRTIVFSWLNANGSIQTFSTNYYNVLNGIILTKPFVSGNLSIDNFSEAVFNANTSTITLKAGDRTGVISPTIFPLKIDVTAPRKWWQSAINEQRYWYSWDGFHKNGTDDAFGLNTLKNYYFLIYYPEWSNDGDDLFAPVFINDAGTSLELQYGAAPSPAFTNNGLAKFTLLGNYGTYPESGPAKLTIDQMLIPEGYYFVQTGESSYDMVSAADGKAWITWEW